MPATIGGSESPTAYALYAAFVTALAVVLLWILCAHISTCDLMRTMYILETLDDISEVCTVAERMLADHGESDTPITQHADYAYVARCAQSRASMRGVMAIMLTWCPRRAAAYIAGRMRLSNDATGQMRRLYTVRIQKITHRVQTCFEHNGPLHAVRTAILNGY